MTPVWFLYMKITCVTLSFLGIYITSVITFWKEENWYYHLYKLVYKLLRKNTGYNQAKQKLPKISRFTKMTEIVDYNTIVWVTDDEGEICLLVNLKYTVKVADPGSPIRNTPYSTSLVFCETIVLHSQYNTEAATYHYS